MVFADQWKESNSISIMITSRFKNLLTQKNSRIAIVYSIVLIIVMFCPVSNIAFIPFELNFDKCIHIILFSILYITWNKAMAPYLRSQIKALQISIGFGLFTEFIQGLLPHRNGDVYDLLCNFIGIIAGFIVVKYLESRTVNRQL